MNTTTNHLVDEAKARMDGLARGLAVMLGPLDTVTVLTGPAVVILARALGPEKAAEFFRGLADEIEQGDGLGRVQ